MPPPDISGIKLSAAVSGNFCLNFHRIGIAGLSFYCASKRYQLPILNYIVTSNYIHLIVSDPTKTDAIPRTIQFVAGRLGQEYNRRKNRKRFLRMPLSCHCNRIQRPPKELLCLWWFEDCQRRRCGSPFRMEKERVPWDSEPEKTIQDD